MKERARKAIDKKMVENKVIKYASSKKEQSKQPLDILSEKLPIAQYISIKVKTKNKTAIIRGFFMNENILCFKV